MQHPDFLGDPRNHEGRALIAADIAAGYTSFAIDASFNPIPDNARITAELAAPIRERNPGLEVEVGEIKSAGSESTLSTVEEAVPPMRRRRAASPACQVLPRAARPAGTPLATADPSHLFTPS